MSLLACAGDPVQCLTQLEGRAPPKNSLRTVLVLLRVSATLTPLAPFHRRRLNAATVSVSVPVRPSLVFRPSCSPVRVHTLRRCTAPSLHCTAAAQRPGSEPGRIETDKTPNVMLPNMTSSKSSRSSIMPSSLSLSTLRSSTHTTDHDPGSRSASSSISSKGNKLRRKSGIDILSNPSQRTTRSPERQVSPTRKEQAPGEPVPLRALDRKARTWSNRISTFLPSLTTSDTDSQQTGSVRRKPVGSSISSPPPPDSAPPPYYLVDPNSPQSPPRNESTMSPTLSPAMSPDTSSPILPPRPYSGHAQRSSTSSMPPPLIETQIPTSSFSTQQPSHPQIMAPTPPSPEVRRATLLKQEPAARAGTQRSSTSTTDSSPTDNSSVRQGRLQKENTENRSRRNSLQQPKIGQAHADLQTAVSGQPVEQRGRRIASAQTSLSLQDLKPSRISSLPLGASTASPSDGGSQSPSRGRLRRSWLPGGRSRSNSVDVTGKGGQSSSFAWVMSDDTQAEYNPSFLKNGEKVSCMLRMGVFLY